MSQVQANQVVYECVQINQVTKECVSWQAQAQQTLPISKDDANALTIAILVFMAFVFVLRQIRNEIRS